jgi:hypothetical protein
MIASVRAGDFLRAAGLLRQAGCHTVPGNRSLSWNLTVWASLREDLRTDIENLGRALRQPLLAVLTAVAGGPPRPARVVRAIGLDKSLASRFVRAVQTDSDLELMYVVPSPEGLRILADRAAEIAGPERTQEFLAVIQRFEQLLDRIPGGRASIDAQISEVSSDVREKSEHAARQAAFKSMSFLLGHYCETLRRRSSSCPRPMDADGIRYGGASGFAARVPPRRSRFSFFYLPGTRHRARRSPFEHRRPQALRQRTTICCASSAQAAARGGRDARWPRQHARSARGSERDRADPALVGVPHAQRVAVAAR